MKNGERANSLDALRGYAIITMVLAGTIFSYVLPAWMSHIQTPPPDHVFRPDIPGISWVDLVFPFFLFSMGAAMPFAVGHKIDRGTKRTSLCLKALKRGLKLAFFAIFLQHMYPTEHASATHLCMWLMPLGAFVALFMLFGRFPYKLSNPYRYVIEAAGAILAVGLLILAKNVYGRPFSLYRSNIIILVLANMSFFATVVYIMTYGKSMWCRLMILPFVAAILYHADGGWQAWLFKATPVGWLYQFAYLKYLCIVLPGTIAGDMLCQSLQDRWRSQTHLWHTATLLTLSIGIIVFNLWSLYTRQLTTGLLGSCLLAALILCIVRRQTNAYWYKLTSLATCLLLLGLFVEPFEGGIKKDPATLSYYLVTSGLACYALLAFDILCDVLKLKRLMAPLVMAGQNPMIAYVSTALLVNPLLQLTGLYDLMNCMASSPWLAFLRGVLVTSLTVTITMGFTRIKWFWRT